MSTQLSCCLIAPSSAVDSSENMLPPIDRSVSHSSADSAAQLRGSTVDELQCALSGSLDRIVLKALSKNQRERYQSAAALRADINSYLEGRPIKFRESTPNLKVKNRPVRLAVRPEQISIAVLPFKLFSPTISSDRGDEYLVIGLADALTMRLSSLRRLTVRPTGSVVQYEHTGDPFEAGRQLGVAYVVEGSIRRDPAFIALLRRSFPAN